MSPVILRKKFNFLNVYLKKKMKSLRKTATKRESSEEFTKNSLKQLKTILSRNKGSLKFLKKLENLNIFQKRTRKYYELHSKNRNPLVSLTKKAKY